jgi:acyl-CoA thioester hydrolase
MFDFSTPIRVRYADTDQMGFVYYGNYARYFEIGRVEALRSLGIAYKDLEDQGIMMPVLENYSKYIKPAYYDDLLSLRVMVKEMPGTRIRFDYEITNAEGTLLHVGYTVLVFISAETKRVISFPPGIQKALSRFFEKTME